MLNPSVQRKENITLRSILIGLLSLPLNIYLVVQTETVWTTQYPTTMAIFFNAVFTLFILSILNVFLSRYLPKWKFSQAEMLTVYLMVTLACVVSGHDLLQATMCILGHASWFATPENEWQSLFFRYIPDWIAVMDRNALTGYYEGTSNFFEIDHIKAWATPILNWLVFFSALAFSMIMLSVILRKQWIEHEKLSYPIILLPYEMTTGSGFYRSRLLWIGIGIGLGLDLLNGLNFLYPVIPGIPIRHDIGRMFTEKPFNAIGSTPIHLNPYAVGIGFLMPLGLSLSCWVFYLFWKIQLVFGSMTGLNQTPGYPHIDMQSLGAYFALCFFALWVTHKHLWKVFKKIIGLQNDLDISNEPIGYRGAFLWFLLSIAIVFGFCLRAGMSWWGIIGFFSIHFILVLAFTRMRAELGTPTQDFYRAGPSFFLTSIFGSRKIGAETLTGFSFLYGFTRNYRSQPMPNQLEGFKLAEKGSINNKQLLWVMWGSSVIGLLIGFVAFLHAGYLHGSIGIWRGQEAFNDLQRWLTIPSETEWRHLGYFGFGVILTLCTLLMRIKFLWWQLHPLAYPLAGNWNFGRLWFPVFLAWVIKSILVRHGGIGAYRKTLPLFLGMMLGEFIMGSIWAILGLSIGERMYSFKHW
ncbi:hypothetical protein JT359_13530 [Candidatus Poribacteria bacterium]|nr:hypothetical protein [Candidatus Poribacteria bacterium]